jgi:hypothetical protein
MSGQERHCSMQFIVIPGTIVTIGAADDGGGVGA